jgi:hypothetical protein
MHLPLQKSIAYVLSTPEMAATLAGLGVEPVGDAPVRFLGDGKKRCEP